MAQVQTALRADHYGAPHTATMELLIQNRHTRKVFLGFTGCTGYIFKPLTVIPVTAFTGYWLYRFNGPKINLESAGCRSKHPKIINLPFPRGQEFGEVREKFCDIARRPEDICPCETAPSNAIARRPEIDTEIAPLNFGHHPTDHKHKSDDFGDSVCGESLCGDSLLRDSVRFANLNHLGAGNVM